jgi:hypothetical protein
MRSAASKEFGKHVARIGGANGQSTGRMIATKSLLIYQL